MANRPGILTKAMQRLHRPIYDCRLRELVRQILPHLRDGDCVLDVGCGFGALARSILDDAECAANVTVLGLERHSREGAAIEIVEYAGDVFPFDHKSFDVVILADVLHHEERPDQLVAECVRVARRLLIIKDHQRSGPFAQPRIALMDWAANAPYGVPCLYRYFSPAEWTALYDRHGLKVTRTVDSMTLYPPVVNLVFGRRLQCMAVLDTAPDDPRSSA